MNTTYTSQQATILQSMITYMQDPNNWTGNVPKVTDFTPGSVIYTLLSAIAMAVDMNAYSIWQAKQAAYISTATETDLDNKAADYGLTRKATAAAAGTFTFTKLTPAISGTVIPTGALISTIPNSTGSVVTFATIADATLPAGQTSVTVEATCQIAGTTGNLAANTALLVGSSVPGIDGVSLSSNITTGTAEETDDALRTRTLAAFASLARGTEAWYKETALSVTGVSSATTVPQNRGAGTVDVFIVGPDNSIPSPALSAAVQAAIDAGRPCTDDAKEQSPTALMINAAIQIHLLAGYDAITAETAVQTAVSNYINNLGVGAGDLKYIYASQLANAAMTVIGVVNATTAFTDTAVSIYQIPQVGTITVTNI